MGPQEWRILTFDLDQKRGAPHGYVGGVHLVPLLSLSSARKHSEVQYFYYSAIVVLHLGFVKQPEPVTSG